MPLALSCPVTAERLQLPHASTGCCTALATPEPFTCNHALLVRAAPPVTISIHLNLIYPRAVLPVLLAGPLWA